MIDSAGLSAKIIGTGSCVPSNIVTNEDIENRIPGASADWTYNTLGIKERRVCSPEESTADIALTAAKNALLDANISPEEIDLIIVGTTTPRRIAPSTSCYVQHHLGAVNSAAFDLAAVCSGFVYGLTVGLQFIASGTYKNVLIIGADTFSKITDWTRRDCVFFGDGAGAAVITACPKGEGIIAFDLGADGSEEFAWTVPAGGSEQPASTETVEKGLHYWQMDGKAVFRMATLRIPITLSKSLSQVDMCVDDIDHIIPHQPSIGMLKKTAEIAGIPFEKFHTNMDRYANTSAATVPLLLDEVKRSGQLKDGQLVAFVAVGSGWTWGSVLMRWSNW